MIFDLTAKKLISYDPSKSSENLRENFVAFIQGLISFPLDLPGTAYHKCMQVFTRNISESSAPQIHVCTSLMRLSVSPDLPFIRDGRRQ